MTEMPEDWNYSEGREKLFCPHGVGHYAPWASRSTHGCDGCCNSEEYEQAVEAAKKEYVNQLPTAAWLFYRKDAYGEDWKAISKNSLRKSLQYPKFTAKAYDKEFELVKRQDVAERMEELYQEEVDEHGTKRKCIEHAWNRLKEEVQNQQ